MKKKKILIRVSILLIIIACITYMYVNDKNYVPNEEKDAKRIESIKEYDVRNRDNEANTNNNDKTEDITKNIPQGNYNGESLVLTNRADFLQKFDDKDIGMAIANNLIPSSLQYINYIITDCEEDNIEKYFKANKDTIYNVFGIDNITEFNYLYEKVKPLGEVEEITIDINTLVIASNGASFIVGLDGQNKSSTLYIDARVPNKDIFKASFIIKSKKE